MHLLFVFSSYLGSLFNGLKSFVFFLSFKKLFSNSLLLSFFASNKNIFEAFITKFINSFILILEWTFPALQILLVCFKNNIGFISVIPFLFISTWLQKVTDLLLRVYWILMSINNLLLRFTSALWLRVLS